MVISAESSVEAEMPSYQDSSDYQNQYSNQQDGATNLVGLEDVAPKTTSSVDTMIDKVSTTAKDLYKGVHEKAD